MGHPSDWDPLRARLGWQATQASQALPLVAAENWLDSLETLAESIPESSLLVGYSMGARLALGLAIEYPQRFRGLVFISGNPGLESEAARERRRRADLQIAEELEQADADSLAPFLLAWYQSEVFASLSPSQREQEIARKRSQSPEEIQRWSAIMRTNSVARQPNYWPHLSTLMIPMLAVAGELDAKYCEIVQRMGQQAPQTTSHVVAGSGHMIHRENPSQLSQLITAWMD